MQPIERVRRRSPRDTSRALPLMPVTVPRLEPWLGREMAGEEQVDRYANLYTGPWVPEDPHPSEVLRMRSEAGMRLGELYPKMLEKDTDLGGFEAKRREAVLALPRFIVPKDSSPKALEAADFCRASLELINSLETNFSHQLQSRSFGIAIEELVWERLVRGPLAGAVVPVAMIDRPMHRFLFRKGVLHVRQAAGKDAILPPPGKFLVARHGTKDSPWGKPLLDQVYWPWFIKRHVLKFWAVFVEKWAQPTAYVKYPRRSRTFADGSTDAVSTSQDLQAKALEIAKAFQTEYAMAIPEGLAIDLLEASRSGDGSYDRFAMVLTRSQALVYLGEINTSGLRPGTGSYASDEVAARISGLKVKLDARDMGAHWKDELLAPLVQLNLGPDYPVPQLVVEHVDAEDREQRREGIRFLLQAKQPVPRRYAYMTLQVPEPREGEETIDSLTGAPEQPAPPPVPSQVAVPPEDGEPRERRATAPPPVPSAAAALPPPPPPRLVASAAGGDELSLEARVATEVAREATERSAALDEVVAAFRGRELAHHERAQDLVMQAWDAGRFEAGDALRWVAGRLETLSAARALQAAQTHGMGLALSHLIEDGIGPDLWRVGSDPGPVVRPSLLDFALTAVDLQGDLASADTPETAADHWADLLTVDKGIFEQLGDQSRRFAFTVAGVTDARMLLEIQQLGGRAKAEGWGRQRFRDDLGDLYRRNGMTPTSEWHADLVYQNNVRQAEAAVRYAQVVRNPAAHRLIPYLQFVTVGDDKVRARPQHNHQVMEGKIFATSHEIWRTWWYPAGHGCRCLVATINRRRAERLRLMGAEPTGAWPTVETGRAMPDPGFRAAPDLASAAAGVELTQLLPIVDEAKAIGNTDLLAALRMVLEALGLLARLREFLGLSEAA